MPRNAVKASMWKNGHESLQVVTVMSSLHISGNREPCKQRDWIKRLQDIRNGLGGSSVGKDAYYAV